ncbi:FUSC family protein [Kitasatospora acidiphila]|uniref:FUSC family protein n=1 Tax=Kitasatospora acidiphila TaxID=2567942 RepID=A0A540WBK5_9ACTN|nr:FUSC family protein [Kitasatospora acidiphila]TQF06342.1 FUSC family protein [Kitasatospora acidiphila]
MPPFAAPAGGWRRALVRVLSPRGALALHRVEGAALFALRAALAMALPALPLVLSGHADLAVYAMLGAFTTTFGRNLPYRRRGPVLAVVALAMTACVAGGSALAAAAHPHAGGLGAALVVLAMAAVAGLAKFACDAARLGGLGAVMLLFSFAVAANGSPDPAELLPQIAAAALGAALAWALAMAGRLVSPEHPQRLAVAAALHAVADLLDGSGNRARATVAVLQAYQSLGSAPPTAAARSDERPGLCLHLADLSWSLLIGSARRPRTDFAALAPYLRRQARLLADWRRRAPALLPQLSVPVTAARAHWSRASADPGTRSAAELRAAELLTGRQRSHHSRLAVLVVPALRMVLGAGIAGALALALDLGHGYWAAISAAAVLHSVDVRTAAQRAVQRTLGTAAGLAIALAVLALHPTATWLVLVIVALEFLLEYLVARNYGLGVVFLTPLALLLSDLASPTSTERLLHDRALGSVLGITVGLLCALLVVHDQAAVRVQRALAACREATDRAEQALTHRTEQQLPAIQADLASAVVELRAADSAAAGELWPAEIDPARLAAAEQRAYLLLERLSRQR